MQSFPAVISPDEPGYTADKASIPAIDNVSHDHDDINETVTYTPDNQKATVKYIDDTTGKTLTSKDLTGKSDAKSGYTTMDTIKGYEDQGYDFVSDQTNGQEIVFDHDDKNNQTYGVHLKHGTVTVTPKNPGPDTPNTPINPKDPDSPKYPKGTDKTSLTKTVTETVTYKNSDGTPVPNNLKPKKQTLTFENTKVIDKVTGEVISDTWTSVQNFPEVASPEEPGYTADKASIPAIDNVGHDHGDINETVTYTPDVQKATVTYIDDTTGTTLFSKSLSGVSNGYSGYTTTATIQDYEDQGYDLVSDGTNGQGIIFDNDDNYDQSYEVHLKHGTATITDHKTVMRTVHYVDDHGQPVHGDTVQQATFNRTGTRDKVTKIITWNPWTPDGQTLTAIVPPEVPGYTPNAQLVSSQPVTVETTDITVTVIYSPKQPDATTPHSHGDGVPTTPDDGDNGLPTPPSKRGSYGNNNLPTPPNGYDNSGLPTPPNGRNVYGSTGQTSQSQLPQTGNDANTKTGIFGFMLAGLAALFGFDTGKKKRRN